MFALNAVFYALLFVLVTGEQYKGDTCKFPNGDIGKCTSIRSCPDAIKHLINKIRPQHCGFEGFDPIVCCKEGATTPIVLKPIVVKPIVDKPIVVKPIVVKPIVVKPIVVKPIVVKPIVVKPIVTKPVSKTEKYCMEIQSLSSRARFLRGSIEAVKAELQEFPHVAALGYGDKTNPKWNCGGTLISSQYILTAAHCLNSKYLGEVKYVRLGDLNPTVSENDEFSQDFRVTKRIYHPDYKLPSRYNDIALLMLDRPVEINDYVKPACLSESENVKRTFINLGWKAAGNGEESSNDLFKLRMDVISKSECEMGFRNIVGKPTLKNGIIEEMHICTGVSYDFICSVDTGGPLQKSVGNSSQTTVVYGVKSFGATCLNSNVSGVYTKVSHYIKWIESVVWPSEQI